MALGKFSRTGHSEKSRAGKIAPSFLSGSQSQRRFDSYVRSRSQPYDIARFSQEAHKPSDSPCSFHFADLQFRLQVDPRTAAKEKEITPGFRTPTGIQKQTIRRGDFRAPFTLSQRNLKTEVSLYKRIHCFNFRPNYAGEIIGHFGFVFEGNSGREIEW